MGTRTNNHETYVNDFSVPPDTFTLPNCDLIYQHHAIELVFLRPLCPQYTILHVGLQELVYGIQQWILCTFSDAL
jgi:hypothetical protein